jgi:hypothetical protein
MQPKNQHNQPQTPNPVITIAGGLLLLAAVVTIIRFFCHWSQCYLLKAREDVSRSLWLTEYRVNT